MPPVKVVPEKLRSEPPVKNLLPAPTFKVPWLVKAPPAPVATSLVSLPVVVSVPLFVKAAVPPVVNLLPLPVMVRLPLFVKAPKVVKVRPSARVKLPVDALVAKCAKPLALDWLMI